METARRLPGLRERKKRRTRDTLLRTALELFVTQGYERTTVDEIAEAADVSQRTFFRYFAGKEEAVFFPHDLAASHFVAAVRARPPHEAPLEALRQAILEGWDGIGEALEQVIPVELHLRTYRLIESTPVLLATHLRRSAEVEEEVARVIAEREGLDVDTDPRPRVAVALFGGVMRVTERLWSASEDITVASMHALTASYLDAVGPVLTQKWRGERSAGENGE
ncbi:TetR family transcriptional regulator [Streptomyces sp. NPDC048664]|uniref:TetR family transcriptional regulator n=1 Tax=Streptomyces sp. NPDC048664 TaxID=3154505 RepID=UPI0034217FAF